MYLEVIYKQERHPMLTEFFDAIVMIGLCRVQFDGLVESLHLPVGPRMPEFRQFMPDAMSFVGSIKDMRFPFRS